MIKYEKLSTYLNGIYTFQRIKDSNLDEIYDITVKYIEKAEKNVFKQPEIALRVIKIELLEIFNHYNNYIVELDGYVRQLNAIVSKGPRIGEENLKKALELESKRDTMAEFVHAIESALGYLSRFLLEHYAELGADIAFMENYKKFNGPFDILSKIYNKGKNPTANTEDTTLAGFKKLLAQGQLKKAIKVLTELSDKFGGEVSEEVMLISGGFYKLEEEYRFRRIPNSEYLIESNKIRHSLSKIYEKLQKN